MRYTTCVLQNITKERNQMDQRHVFFLAQIAEAALDGDKELVESNLGQLIAKLGSDGEQAAASRLRKVLDRRGTRKASASHRASKPAVAAKVPVDAETAFGIADRSDVAPGSVSVVLPAEQQRVMSHFVQYVKATERLRASGAEVSPTLLLYGPPGTGKTLVAKVIASELGLPLVTARTDGLISSYLGSTAKNLRRLFEYARSAPCVLFLDEFDAIAKMRDDSKELGELKRVVISLLQNIDTLDSDHVLVAATNHEHLLDRAIWRRFAYKLKLELPDLVARHRMLSAFFGRFMGEDAIACVAPLADQLSGAQLKMVAEECIRSAVLANAEAVTTVDVMEAIAREAGRPVADKKDLIVRLYETDKKLYSQPMLAKLFKTTQQYISKVISEAKKERDKNG